MTPLRRRLNPQLAGMQKSATLAIHERSAALHAQGVDVIRFGLGQSPFPVPPSVADGLRRNAHQKAYLPVEGLPELRASIAGYLQRTEGIDVAADRIIVGPGTKELMFLLQFALDTELVVPAPSWVSYAPQARLNQREVSWLQTDDRDELRVTPESLDALCRASPDGIRILILNYPGNPTGTSYSAEQLRDIAAVARRHGVLVLSDEIYSGLTFSGEHASIARYYPEGTIISNGLSKWCGAGGWRLGAFAFPRELDWLHAAMAAAASETFSAVSAPIQYAAIVAFDGNAEIDDYLSRSRRLLRALLTTSARRLRAAGAAMPEPQGGFYLLPRLDEDCARFRRQAPPQNSAELCEKILTDTGVAILPGSGFGLPPDQPFVRLAAVDFNGEAALAAFDGMAADAIPDETFLREHCGRTMTGIDRLCAWIGARDQEN